MAKKKELLVVPPPDLKELPLVVTETLTPYSDIMGKWIAKKMGQGYALSCPPVFVGYNDPMRYGFNIHAIGRQPDFLVVMNLKSA